MENVVFSGFSVPFSELWDLMDPLIRSEIVDADLDLDNQEFLYMYMLNHYMRYHCTFDEVVFDVFESYGDGANN